MRLSTPVAAHVVRRAAAAAVLVCGGGLPLAVAAETSRATTGAPTRALFALAWPAGLGLSDWPEPVLLATFGVALIGSALVLRRTSHAGRHTCGFARSARCSAAGCSPCDPQ